MISKAMTYEETPVKICKKLNNRELERMSSFAIVWFLVKRHKLGLMAAGNIILVLNWAFPAWTELVKSLIQ
jgi:hypothetical protein